MNFDDIEIGKCYSRHDDAVYKVIDKSNDWICVLHYSYNHHVCNAEFWREEDLDGLEEETEDLVYDYVFGNLKFVDWQMLKENDCD